MLKKISTALALLAAAPLAQAGVVLSEDWTGGTPTATTINASGGTITVGARTWTATKNGTGTASAVQLTDFSGNLKLDNTAAGTSTSDYTILTTTGVTGFVAGKAVTIEFDFRDPTPATTSNQRTYVLVENATSHDGYRIRFSTQTNSEEVFNATIVDSAVEVGDKKFDDSNNGSGGFGVPNAAGEWHTRMSFIPVGADTKVIYEVTGLNGTPNLLAKNSWTFTSAAVQDAFDSVSVWMRRPLGQFDNLVISQDTEAPTLTLTGSTSITLNCGDSFTDDGATATDAVEGDLTSSIVVGGDTVNTAVAGTYVITYDVSDHSGNAATQVTRTVTVQDLVDPIVTLTGAGTVSVNCGDFYTDAGATASDACSGVLTPVPTGTVNTAVPGDYTITYTATDASGNDASVSRTVTVLNNCPAIIITPTTATSVTLEEGEGPVSFGINAAGTGALDYQWFFDGGAKAASELVGETSATITIPVVGLEDDGQYYCEVTDDFNVVNSAPFTLIVNAQVPVAGFLGLIGAATATAVAGMAALRRKR